MKKKSSDIVFPIHLSTTFIWEDINKPPQHEYSRISNPTMERLEISLSSIFSAYALSFSSGQSAVLTSLLAFLKSKDTLLMHTPLYEGTVRLTQILQEKCGINVKYKEINSKEELIEFKSDEIKAVFLEFPSSYNSTLINLKDIVEWCHENQALCIVDNSLAPNPITDPLHHGADLSIISATKNIGGHNDIMAGIILTKNKELWETFKHYRNELGTAPDPFNTYLLLRSIKTYQLRIEKQVDNALKIARSLSKNTRIDKILLPPNFVPNKTQKELAEQYVCKKALPVLFFTLKDKNVETVKSFLNKLKYVKIAQSYGGDITTIQVPTLMMNLSEISKKWISDETVLRLSVGIDDPALVIKDLNEALELLE